MPQEHDPGNDGTLAGQSYRSWKNWSTEAFGQFNASDALYFSSELAKSGIQVVEDMAVLELGFGNGKFAGWAVSQNMDYTGTELDPTLVEIGRKFGLRAFQSTLDHQELADGRRFSLVVAFDVLEHLSLDQSVTILRSLSQCLHDDGVILARCPSGDSPFSGPIQYGDSTHVSVIGSGMVGQLAASACLEVREVRAPVLPVFGLGARTAWSPAATGSCAQVYLKGHQPHLQ